ncbi:FAD-dependent monooxygenase [Pigmentiphaga sp. GD03639]|uniref:FAD-dependent monooxygenase n=1 Tax=unclassified Pigmentiphaga TaxID=2626614 RepID=UPI00244D6B66|nr:FAD-dependent monooxygenase [Pigmentiphaga sp. GD03639]MDH2239218.1 FAD-dependent monooxygenase [Pigmentiphaga sp. GD03639]
MKKDAFQTDVLVVGSGPMGATTALALATYGVRVQVVNRYNWTANTPRAHITNQRAMEVLRDLGLEDEARRRATPWEWMGDTLFTTSLAGPEIARLRTWGTGDERIGDYLQASPCPMLDLPQNKMEPMLVTHAAARGAVFSFNTEYLGHEQDADGVTVSLRDVPSGREYAVRSRYLVGADGARSKVMDDAGLELRGQLARAATAYVLFRADLSRYAAHRPSILYWIATSNAAFGEIGLGLLRAIEPWDQWIAGWGFDMEKGEPDFSPGEILKKVRILVGDPDLEIEIDNASVWYVNQAHAPVYSKGRVFCGGDAVHRHPPSSGLGSNTCMQDAFNLAWKLAFVLRGHAGTGLLDSYSLERAPVGAQIVARANQSRLDYGPLNECFREAGAEDPVAAGLARLAAPDAEGVARRAALAEALRLKNYEFNAQGVELNQRYASAAIIAEPDAGEETWRRDPQLHAQASTRPGAKLPHAWLVGSDGRRVSTLDVVGRGKFTLLTGLAGQAWKEAAAAMDLPFLRTVVIGEPGALDSYCTWHALREIEESGALLVRPDGIVAWRRHSGEGLDAAGAGVVLETALAKLLDRAR